MKVKAKTARHILDLVSEKTGFTQDFTGFREMSNVIGLKNEDYLYKKIYLKIQGKNEKSTIGVGRLQINLIINFLGFKSFHHLEYHVNDASSLQLSSFTGSYYCYVRANQQTGIVFRSPVRISVKDSKASFELKGPKITYSGVAHAEKGCLFILMNSKKGKVFHHIYKIGERDQPEVLQGVFSGVSTAFDPIAGRTVLIRQENDFKELTNKKMNISHLKKSKHADERALAAYFVSYHNNNIAPNKSSSFSTDDLY